MAVNQTPNSTHSPESDSQSDDDIDEMFKQELSRMEESQGVQALDGNGATLEYPESTTLPDPVEPSGINSEDNNNTIDHISHSNGQDTRRLESRNSLDGPSSVISSMWQWSVSSYRWTRQLLAEGFGRQSKTIDPVLRSQIMDLYGTRRQYRHICKIVTLLAANFEKVLHSQQDLSNAFRLMSVQNETLVNEFQYNAELQDVLYKNGGALLAAMKVFISGVGTLCNQTMVDTLWTAKQLNYARIQYDALKSEIDSKNSAAGSGMNDESQGLSEGERNFELQKQAYEKLKQSLQVKLQLLHENRVSVMHRQLESFHNAVEAYFSGNHADLEAALKQFHIQPFSTDTPSWLEIK